MLNHSLTDKELAFVVELLTAESAKLMRESRHVDARDARHGLRERLRTVDRLLERFSQFKEGTLTP